MLELPADASHEQIASRYRRRLFDVHPDYHADVSTEQSTLQLMEVIAAYRALRDDEPVQPGPHSVRRDRVRRGPARRAEPVRPSPPGHPPIVAGPVMVTPYSTRSSRRRI